jgi:Protein of unknown function (DUF4232)
MDSWPKRWSAHRRVGRVVALGLATCALGCTLLSGCALTSSIVSACGGASVRITVGQFGVGHGHFGGALLFRNDGSTACTLRGYPVARAVATAGGRPIAALDSPRGYVGGLLPGSTHPPMVTLVPGAIASAILEGAGAAPASRACPRYRALLVGVPGGRASTALAIETAVCRRLQIHPIVPGESGDQSP